MESRVRTAHHSDLIGFLFDPHIVKIRKIQRPSRRASPMGIIHAKFYPTVERRIRPIRGALDQAVLYRIVMDVIEMPLEIAFIAQRMFRVIALPNATSAMGNSGFRADFFRAAQGKPGLGEMFFDRAASPSHPPGTAASAGNNPEKLRAINRGRGRYPKSEPASQSPR